MIRRIEVKANLGQARKALERARNLAAGPRPLLEIAGSILEESTRERFRTSTGPGGIPWPTSRRAQLQGGRTLIDRGGLISSITHVADEKQVEVGVIAKTESARFAYVHQFGAVITPKKGPYLIFRGADGHLIFARSVRIPARPFIGLDEDDRADLLAAWTAFLEASE